MRNEEEALGPTLAETLRAIPQVKPEYVERYVKAMDRYIGTSQFGLYIPPKNMPRFIEAQLKLLYTGGYVHRQGGDLERNFGEYMTQIKSQLATEDYKIRILQEQLRELSAHEEQANNAMLKQQAELRAYTQSNRFSGSDQLEELSRSFYMAISGQRPILADAKIVKAVEENVKELNETLAKYFSARNPSPAEALEQGCNALVGKSLDLNARTAAAMEVSMHEFMDSRIRQNMRAFSQSALHHTRGDLSCFQERQQEFARVSKAAMEKFRLLLDQYEGLTLRIREYEQQHQQVVDSIRQLK